MRLIIRWESKCGLFISFPGIPLLPVVFAGLAQPAPALNPFGILLNTRLLSQLVNIPDDGSRFKRTEQLLGYLS